jgi:hypothetical protein
MNTVLAFLFMVAISQILPRGQMKIFFMKIQNKKELIKSCPQAGFRSPPATKESFYFLNIRVVPGRLLRRFTPRKIHFHLKHKVFASLRQVLLL